MSGRPTRRRRSAAADALAWCLAILLFAAGARADDPFALCLGSGGTVEAPAPKLPADAKGFAVEFRFKALAPSGQAVRVVSQWSDDAKAADGGAYHVDAMPGNKLAFTLRVGKGRTDTVTAKDAWTPHVWHHVLATWNGADASLYLDGKQIGTRKIDAAQVPATRLPLTIGQPAPAAAGKPAVAPPTFKGFVSDVAAWGVAPTPEAAAARAANPIAEGATGLIAHLLLREVAPAEVTKEAVSGQEAKLSPALARTGWCATPMWDQPAPAVPNLHVFSYDLSAPARAAGGAAAPAPAAGAADAPAATSTDAAPALVKPTRMILIQNAKTQQFGVLWQEREGNGIFVTWLDADLKSHETIRLKSMEDGILAAGCADPNGNLCYVEIQKAPAERDAAKPLKALFHAAAATGKALGEVPLSTAAGENGLNVWNYGGRWVGSMAFAGNSIGMILPRTMYKSPDGLNHQGAIGVVFPASDPAKYKNHGQISGHSFGNVLAVSAANEFIGLDLGDCYPRGVHLSKFTAAGKSSRVVFTYKTQHATSPSNNSPKYDEISTDGKTFYKWSNDNNTYTELGNAIEGKSSYSVIFSTDRSVEGKVLDNSRAFSKCDDPRDLAMVRIVRNFEQVKSSNEVSDALLAGGPPPGSTSETGGFFNFVGSWTKQRQTGVIWLTKHKTGESAHAPHAVRLPDGNVLILWEKTSPDGPSLHATKVGEDGKILGQAMLPGSSMRLNREDRFIAAGGRNFVLTTNPATGGAQLSFVYDDIAPAASPAAKPTPPATTVRQVGQ